MKKISVVMLIFITLVLTSWRKTHSIDINNVKNIHRVSDDLYRSGQPQHKGMMELDAKGFKTIVNLRNGVDDQHELHGTKLKEIRIPIQTKKLDYDDVLQTMIAFRDAEKPMLVHCRRGSDRTGCMVAAYRLAFLGWSKEEAIESLLDKNLGYLDGMFPNILQVIQDLDVAQLKRDMKRH